MLRGPGDLLATCDDGRFDALATGAGDSSDVEDGQGHWTIVMPRVPLGRTVARASTSRYEY
jgi:hypothetical protein